MRRSTPITSAGFLAASALVALLIAACGGSDPPPPQNPPPQQGYYPPPQQGGYPPPQQGAYPPPQQTAAPPPPTATAPGAAPGGTMATPGPLALPCQNDGACLTHRCNTQFGKCAAPCQGPVDCAPGNQCMMGVCAPIPHGSQ